MVVLAASVLAYGTVTNAELQQQYGEIVHLGTELCTHLGAVSTTVLSPAQSGNFALELRPVWLMTAVAMPTGMSLSLPDR